MTKNNDNTIEYAHPDLPTLLGELGAYESIKTPGLWEYPITDEAFAYVDFRSEQGGNPKGRRYAFQKDALVEDTSKVAWLTEFKQRRDKLLNNNTTDNIIESDKNRGVIPKPDRSNTPTTTEKIESEPLQRGSVLPQIKREQPYPTDNKDTATNTQGGFLAPATTIQNALETFNMFENAKTKLLNQNDVLWIGRDGRPSTPGKGGKPHIKRSGWRKMARFFGLNCTIINREKIKSRDSEGEFYLWMYTVRATHPNGCHYDGEGIATSRDPFFSKKGGVRIEPNEANIMMKAQTIAFNRAISDLLGSGEVSADEMVEVE